MKIENEQLRAIYGISRNIGMDNDDLHTLTEALTGKVSLKTLSKVEALALVGELKARQKAKGGQPTAAKRHKEEKPGGVSHGQQGKIWALLGELEKWDVVPSKASHKERLCGVIKHELHMDASSNKPFHWLTMRDGVKLIDALLRYVKHAEQKALREGRAKHG